MPSAEHTRFAHTWLSVNYSLYDVRQLMNDTCVEACIILQDQQDQAVRGNAEDDALVDNLAFDITELKQQVRDLLVRKSIHETLVLVSRQRLDAGVTRTTQLFCQVLQDGFREWEAQEDALLEATLDEVDIASGVTDLIRTSA